MKYLRPQGPRATIYRDDATPIKHADYFTRGQQRWLEEFGAMGVRTFLYLGSDDAHVLIPYHALRAARKSTWQQIKRASWRVAWGENQVKFVQSLTERLPPYAAERDRVA